jgi:hypothetical protein
MWFFVNNGDLNKCFEDFYNKLLKSKLIFLSFKELNILERPEVNEFIDEALFTNDENIKDYLNSLHFLGTGGINIYMYESLYTKIYSEYEYFIKDLVAYFYCYDEKKYKSINCKKDKCIFNSHNYDNCIECMNVKIDDYSFNIYKQYLESEIQQDNDLMNLINDIDNCRLVRNHIVHNSSFVNKSIGYKQRSKIQNVVKIYDELEPFEFIEITDKDLVNLYDKIEDLLHKLKEYFTKYPNKFRIKNEIK